MRSDFFLNDCHCRTGLNPHVQGEFLCLKSDIPNQTPQHDSLGRCGCLEGLDAFGFFYGSRSWKLAVHRLYISCSPHYNRFGGCILKRSKMGQKQQ